VAPRHAQPISDVSQERLLVLQLHTMAALCIHHDLFPRADPIEALRGIINPIIAHVLQATGQPGPRVRSTLGRQLTTGGPRAHAA